MGLRPVKLADMEEYIRVVRGLLAGETLEWSFEDKRRKIRFLNPEIGAINITDPIPLHISAHGTARPAAHRQARRRLDPRDRESGSRAGRARRHADRLARRPAATRPR